jgi:1,4-alpha-glucan branching enzyme
MQSLVRDLNGAYRDLPALHEGDCEAFGFEWIEAGDADNSVFAFIRRSRGGERQVVVVSNFTPIVRQGYRLGVPGAGRYVERVNTDAALYGGSNQGNAGEVQSTAVPSHGRPHAIELTLPPLATLIFEWIPA